MQIRIEDYAIIGNCETAALVGRNGSIDWLCWPRFDSEACFTALLDSSECGRWLVAPTAPDAKVMRRYRPDTLVLETQFVTDTGAATVIDFMPMRGEHRHLIRLVKGDRGCISFATELVIRFGYGAIVPWVTRMEDHSLRAIAGPDKLVLRTPVNLRGENFKTRGEFTIEEAQTVAFVLSYVRSHLPDPPAIEPTEALRETEQYWHEWASKARLSGPWVEAQKRSLITLKALTYAPTGGLVAAVTTSLPEQLRGSRNWDYRFCWLRDATFTLLALMNSGFHDEAGAWRDWLLRAAAGRPEQMQIMYGVAGERRLTEIELPWLAGYERSRPVRIGNDAHRQLQLDIYGELTDTLHQARMGGIALEESGWALQLAVLSHLEKHWREPDHGIWEVRNKPQHFTYSKVMAWVAFDRAIKSARRFGLAGPVDRWCKLREEIHAEICSRAFNAELGSFVSSYGSKEVDASLLLVPAVGFLPPIDSRICGTIALIERELMRNGLVRRYDTEHIEDGLPAGEGYFLACSFWLVDAYVLLGRYDDAKRLFDHLLTLRNDVGLLSEEYDPVSDRFLGNFPQAFSHLALVNSAANISRLQKPAEQRSAS